MDKARSDSISNRIRETTLETERLKRELEALLKSEIDRVIPQNQQPFNSKSNRNPIPIIKSYELNVQKRIETIEPAQKKSKPYNKQEIMDHIRKQREKRLVEVKNNPKVSARVAAELRKEKLQELHEKAREIVRKNVETRARSRSRESHKSRSRSASTSTKNSPHQKSSNKSNEILKSSEPLQSRLDSASGASRKSSAVPIEKPQSPLAINDELAHGASYPNLLHPLDAIDPERRLRLIAEAKFKQENESRTTLRAPSVNLGIETARTAPEWLKDVPKTDPYNFMNTVKRQLRYALEENKPFVSDVPVQSAKPLSASFISHKCLNLDPKTVEHVELDRKNLSAFSNNYNSDNESNTSNNIPSIASENPELSPPSPSVLKVKKQLFQESYSSDFASDLSDKRSSIISYNSVSPNALIRARKTDKLKTKDPKSDVCESNQQVSVTSSTSEAKKTLRSESKQKEIQHLMRNVTIRNNSNINMKRTNENQLKFEAESDLLSDFNQTMRRFSEIEKTFESLRDVKKYLEDQQQEQAVKKKIDSACSELVASTTSLVDIPKSDLSRLESLQLDFSEKSSLSRDESLISFDPSTPSGLVKGVLGMSLKMFDKIIKDEDDRIVQWRHILKIKEDNLLIRTRNELVYLEIQKKQLIETGKLAEASTIKKKQRGILLKHQEERHEMQKLKQKQKNIWISRKAQLKKEKNKIKNHLFSNQITTKLKHGIEMCQSGPVKVLQTASKDAGDVEEKTYPIENKAGSSSGSELRMAVAQRGANISYDDIANLKKTLLARENILSERRKTVEDLLEWHKKLSKEEKVINNLEKKVKTIIAKEQQQQQNSCGSVSQISGKLTPTHYTADFEDDPNSSVSSISQMIDTFSKIEDTLLNLSVVSMKKSSDSDLPQDKCSNEETESVTQDSPNREIGGDEEKEENDIPSGELTSTDNEIESQIKEDDDAVDDEEIPSTDQRHSEEIEESLSTDDSEVHTPTSVILNQDIEEDRQSFENKTDEEKAASLREISTDRSRTVEEITLSNSVAGSSTEITTEQRTSPEKILSIKGRFSINSNTSGVLTESEESGSSSSQSSKSVNEIKSHVQEILNSASSKEKRPRLQDLCLLTFDVSSAMSPDACLSNEEKKPFSLGSEAEELHRKQLAIEQEIKLLKEQQQKGTASPFYIREIPNKPPPPYTPPSRTKSPKSPSVLPGTREEVEQITEYSAKIIYKAYLSNNLEHTNVSEKTLNLIAKDIDKSCYKYIFDLCKEIAQGHYSQFPAVENWEPSWLVPMKKSNLAPIKPLDVNGLKMLMRKRVLELHGFEVSENKRENAIEKWSRKKRDHVDEVLVKEMHAENDSWTNYEKDEAIIMDQITNEIFSQLITDTLNQLKKVLVQKS
ncbi:hypothetical protein ABEB36_006255 [Hypothenemus hampei]|uniref:Centrosome-associated protein 350 n=1 Tax=Hypothenemus hampei TaxID=57062 RepID=A0ABD1EPW8_HYPHA